MLPIIYPDVIGAEIALRRSKVLLNLMDVIWVTVSSCGKKNGSPEMENAILNYNVKKKQPLHPNTHSYCELMHWICHLHHR